MPIFLTHPLRHGGKHLHTKPPPPRQRQKFSQGISLGTFNLRGGRDSGLTQTIRAVQMGSFDLMILTETIITDQDYFCNRLGYNVVFSPMTTAAAGITQGGVGLVVQDQPQGWRVKSKRFHGPNGVIGEVVTDRKRTPIIGAYLPSSALEYLP